MNRDLVVRTQASEAVHEYHPILDRQHSFINHAAQNSRQGLWLDRKTRRYHVTRQLEAHGRLVVIGFHDMIKQITGQAAARVLHRQVLDFPNTCVQNTMPISAQRGASMYSRPSLINQIDFSSPGPIWINR